MAKAITEIAIGAAAIGASIFVPGIGIAIGSLLNVSASAVTSSMLALGGSAVMSGIGDALHKNQGGLAVAVTTPIGPWGYVYGTQKVGGVQIFEQSNNNTGGGSTSNNKQLHRVFALASHPCLVDAGTWQLRIDGKQVLTTPSGAGHQSYSPTQIMQPITTMTRDSFGLVTVVISSGISGLDGTEIQITECGDNTFNGIWIVTQPNPTDNTTFTFVSGGTPTTVTSGQFWTLYADYEDKIYVEFLNGNHTSTFVKLSECGTNWGATDLCLGRTLAYVQMGWSQSVFPSSIPNLSFVIQGKNNIWDPRTSTYGWTDNAALCIADYLCTPQIQGGFGLSMGTDIPSAQLIAAANICDEAVSLAAGGTIPRYTCNTFFQLNDTRGSILKNMLSSCAGRISYQGGTYSIFPGAWVSPSLSLTDADIVAPIQFKPRLSIRDTCNGVKGTFVSPENNYQQADFPPYMQDVDHGYVSDPWLAEDNAERIFLEINQPCVDNSATAQRIAKIALLRTRYQMRLTIRCSLKAYQAVALDVIELTHPRYTWVNKTFEVLSSKIGFDKSNPSAPTPYVELDLAETDSSIYDWIVGEQLTPQGYAQPSNVGNSVCQWPDDVVAYSGPGAVIGGITYPSTVTTGADGRVLSSLYVRWNTPNDANVVSGGYIEIQWQLNGASTWTPFGKVDPSVAYAYILGVTDGDAYNVQVRAVNCANVPSPWIEAGPITITDAYSSITSAGINPNSPYNINNDATIDSVDVSGAAEVRIYGPGGVGTAWDNITGQGSTSYPYGTLTGLAYTTMYTLIWDTATSAYSAVTNYNDSLSDTYITVGGVVTCASGGSGGTPGGGTGGPGGPGGPRSII